MRHTKGNNSVCSSLTSFLVTDKEKPTRHDLLFIKKHLLLSPTFLFARVKRHLFLSVLYKIINFWKLCKWLCYSWGFRESLIHPSDAWLLHRRHWGPPVEPQGLQHFIFNEGERLQCSNRYPSLKRSGLLYNCYKFNYFSKSKYKLWEYAKPVWASNSFFYQKSDYFFVHSTEALWFTGDDHIKKKSYNGIRGYISRK